MPKIRTAELTTAAPGMDPARKFWRGAGASQCEEINLTNVEQKSQLNARRR